MCRNLRKTAVLFLSAALILTTGCATAIKLEVERPPQLNTAGIKRIAVMPFEGEGKYTYDTKSSGLLGTIVNKAVANLESDNYSNVADHATYVAANKIQQMNHFTLVPSSEIKRLQSNNQDIGDHVDALFTGKIININWGRDTEKNKEGETIYVTNVEVNFSYHLVLAKDGNLAGPVFKTGKKEDKRKKDYPSGPLMVREAISNELNYLYRDLVPHTVTEKRTFKEDKALKSEMKNALALVKAKNYKAALEAYLKIYEQHKSLAAAENASIMYESFGDIKAAADLMQRAFDDTGNPDIKKAIARLNKILQDRATIASDYGDGKPADTQPADIRPVHMEPVEDTLPLDEQPLDEQSSDE